MDRLPERFRAPVVLHYFEGLSAEATAQRLGCARGTVLSRLSRARHRIKQRLEQQGVSYRGAHPGRRSDDPMAPADARAGLAGADATVRAASSMGLAGAAIESVVPAAVASLSRGVARTLVLSRVGVAARCWSFVAAGVSIGLAATLQPDEKPQRAPPWRSRGGTRRRGPARGARRRRGPNPWSCAARSWIRTGSRWPVPRSSCSAAGQDLGRRERLGTTGPDGRFEVAIPGTDLRPRTRASNRGSASSRPSPGARAGLGPIDPTKRASPSR